MPKLDDTGRVIRVSGTTLDVTERTQVRRELERSKVRLQETESLAQVGGWEWELATNTGRWSDEVYRIHGAKPQSFDAGYDAFLEFVHPEDRDRVDKEFHETFDFQTPRWMDYRIITTGGDVRFIESLAQVLTDSAGNAVTMVGSVQDITRRRQAEEELQRAHDELENLVGARTRELRTTLDTVVDGIITIDHRGIIEAFSRSAEIIFGYRAGDVIGENVKILMAGPDQEQHDRHLSRYAKTGESGIMGVGRELVGRRRDGNEFPIQLSIGEMSVGGRVKYVGTVQDISARKKAEEELREREERLVAISQMSPVGLVRTSADGEVTYGNDTFYQIMGRSPEEVAGKGWIACLHPDDRERITEEWQQYAGSGEVYRCEYRVVKPNGDLIWIQGETAPSYDADGVLAGHIGTLTDMTARKQVEAALEESEARFRAIIENSTDVVVILNEEARYKYVSPPGMRLTGLELESLEDFSALDFILPEDADVFMDAFRSAQGSPGETIFVPEYRVKSGGGDVVYIEALLTALPGLAGVEGVVVNAREITERKLAEQEIERARDSAEAIRLRLNDAIENIKDGFMLFDKDDRLILCNSAYQVDFKSIESFLEPGTRFGDFLRAMYDSDDILKPEFRTEENFERRLKQHQDPESGPWMAHLRDGRWVLIHEYRTQEGGIAHLRSDITERVNAEQENLRNKELAEAASNAKSDFLSSMSHELRTPMNAILGFSQLLDMDTINPLTEEQHTFVGEILQSGRHMMELIGDVLDLAKIESGNVTLKIEDRQPGPLIDMCLTMISAAADKDGISVTSNLVAAEMPKLRIDPLRFKQAMLNLLSNAVKYNRPDGSVVLDSCADENGMLRISVTDTGEGIPEELIDEVFEPFERLGAQSSEIQGTGIGLTVTKQMVEDMGGAIGFDSKVGKGTTFWIDVPVA